jgi:hypothetical protein
MSAASSTNVVRQLMTQPLSQPLRSLPQGNADNGGKDREPLTAFSVVTRFVSLESSLTRMIYRTPTRPITAPTLRAPHLCETVRPTRDGSDPRVAPYKTHRQVRGSV